MTPETAKWLEDERPGELHDKLLVHVKGLAELSRDRMHNYYERWKSVDASFRSQVVFKARGREEQRNDKKAEERGEPTKFVLPIGHSQVDTFVSFCYQMYTQRNFFYELDGQGLEDTLAKNIAEQCLEYDLQQSNFRGPVLIQTLHNLARYSFGVIKHSWVEESMPVEQSAPQSSLVEGLAPVMEQTTVREPFFQGNRVVTVSPYRFLPDPRLPLFRFQDGEFCGDEDYVSYSRMKNMAADGTISGLEHVQKAPYESIENREFPFDPTSTQIAQGKTVKDQPYILTEMQISICPAHWSEEPKAKEVLGDEDYPIKFLIQVANDNRIVRISRMNYAHNRFTYDVPVLSPDEENFLGLSLYDIVGPLQDTSNWLINSRITSIRKTISLDMIVDPMALNSEDLQKRSPIIRLNKNFQGTDIRRYVFQLSRNDTTAGNIQDVQFLNEYTKQGTGLTDNLVGQFAPGRRSAREAGNVQANSSNRIKTAASCIWYTGFEPLGKALLSNLRDGLTIPRIVKIIGVPNQLLGFSEGLVQFKQATKVDLAGNFDFRIFDGTLPSDRQQQAAVIQEYLMAGLQNPQIFLVTQHNPTLLFEELLELRGIRNASKFRLTPAQISQLAIVLGASNDTSAAPGNGGEGGNNPQQSGSGGGKPNGGSTPFGPSGGALVAFPQKSAGGNY